MHLLRVVGAIVIYTAALTQCAPQAALTPLAAFGDLKTAFVKKDAAMLERQLSTGSVRKIRSMIMLFEGMDARQRGAIAKKFGIESDRLAKLSVRDFCALTLAFNREKNAIGVATKQNIVGVNRSGGRAVIRVENGMDLVFVKEGPYWKFDMTDL